MWQNTKSKERNNSVTGPVFIDPENLNLATVVLPMVKDPVEVHLQFTAFADMTLPEVLRLMAEYRHEDPYSTEIHEDRIMRTRRHRYDQTNAIGLEHNLKRSYSTVEECRAMAKAVFAGARVTPSRPLTGTTRPGAIADVQPGDGIFEVGGSDALEEATGYPFNIPDDANSDAVGTTASVSPDIEVRKTTSQPKKTAQPREPKKEATNTLLRPQNLKGLK